METQYAFLRNSTLPVPYDYKYDEESFELNARSGFVTHSAYDSFQPQFSLAVESLSPSEFPSNPEQSNIIHICECHKASSPAPWTIPTPIIEPYDPVIVFPTSLTNSPFLPRNSSNGRGSIGSISSAGLSNSALLRLSTSYARASPLSEQDRVTGSPIPSVSNAADALRSSIGHLADTGFDSPEGTRKSVRSHIKILQGQHSNNHVADDECVQNLLSEYLLNRNSTDSLVLSNFESIAEECLGLKSIGDGKHSAKDLDSRLRDSGDDKLEPAGPAHMPFPPRGDMVDRVSRNKYGNRLVSIPFGAQAQAQSQSQSQIRAQAQAQTPTQPSAQSPRKLLSSATKHQSRAVPRNIFTPSASDAFIPLRGITEQYSFTAAPVTMLHSDLNADTPRSQKYSLKIKLAALGHDSKDAIAAKDNGLSPISYTYKNQITHDSASSIRLGKTLLAKASPGEYTSIIKRLLKVAMTHHDVETVIHFTTKLVDMTSTDPRISKEVTDYVRFLEEHGHIGKAAALLIKCVEKHICSSDWSNFPEQLVLKALKLYESIGEYDSCYHLIERTVQQYTQPSFCSSISNAARYPISLDKYWRIVFFGAYLEMIQGNHDKARGIISYLILNVREAGPVMVEYIELELKYGSFRHAFDYVFHYFLREEIAYSPLSLLSFEVLMRGFPRNTRLILGILKKVISSCAVNDIRWKLKCLCALYCLRNNEPEQALDLCFKALACAKDGVHWRIFVLIAKIYFVRSYEKDASDYWVAEMKEKVFNSLTQAYQAAPLKSKLFVTIERAHYYEYYGDIGSALSILLEAITANQKEWKYTLEYASILRRHNRLAEALESIAFSFTLGDNMGTGRLWAFYASTAQSINASSHYMVIRSAIYHCPKSADVWAELARLFMNPAYNCFNLSIAEDALAKAIYYTPQYGDTYIEWLRLLVIRYLVYGVEIAPVVQRCLCLAVDMKPTYGNLWLYCKTKTVEYGYCPVRDFDSPASVSKSIVDYSFTLVIYDIYRNLDLYKTACRNQRKFNDAPADIVSALSLKPETVQKKVPTQNWYSFNTAIEEFNKLHAEALESDMSDDNDKIRLIFGSDLVL